MDEYCPTMARLPSGVVSFLFTDIEGSTRLFHELGNAYRGVLSKHNELLREVWSAHNGSEIKTAGDAFFVAFESAVDALEAAVGVQDAIKHHIWSGAEPRVRVGVHSGLAAPVDDDYVALAVHQAARVVGAANGGQILATGATFDLADGDAIVETNAIGRYRLTGFDEPTLLYEVGGLGQASTRRLSVQCQLTATTSSAH